MNIVKTITYNREQIKPRKRLKKTHHKIDNPPILSIQSNHSNSSNHLCVPYQHKPPLQTHESNPVRSQHQHQRQRKDERQRPRPINPVKPPTHSQIPTELHPNLYSSQSHSSKKKRAQHFHSRSDEIPSLKTLPSENVTLNIYDFGGSISTRKLWLNYKQNVPQLKKNNKIDFIILVIDCTDKTRLNDENYDCIQIAMRDLLNNKVNQKIPVAIFANKQELEYAVDVNVLEYRLGLRCVEVWELIGIIKECNGGNNDDGLVMPWKISAVIIGFLPNIDTYWMMSKRHWKIFGTSGVTKEDKGISDGLQWIYDEYDQQFEKNQSERRLSFTERFRLTM